MKKRMSWYWAVPAVAGLALIMVAALLSSSSPGSPGVPAVQAQVPSATPTATTAPTATATPNPDCVLDISKDADPSEVAAGGEVTYTITVTNDEDGNCTGVVVTDDLPSDLTCVSASVVEEESLDFDQGDIDDSCDDDSIEWAADDTDELDGSDEVVLELVVTADEDLDEGDEVENEVCVNATGAAEACDTETTDIGEPATATPQPTATRQATIQPVVPPPVAPPVVVAAPTIAPPITGTGSGGGSSPLALGLGLIGACLLLVSGAAMVKRTR